MNTLDEKSMQKLESSIPKLARGAVKEAYIRALAAGSTVIEAVDGFLVESHPDGSRKVLRTLAPATVVGPGRRKRRSRE